MRPHPAIDIPRDSRPAPRGLSPRWRRSGAVLMAVALACVAGCGAADVELRPSQQVVLERSPTILLERSRQLRRQAARSEHKGSDACVDEAYAAAVHAWSALESTGGSDPDAARQACLCLAECLRMGRDFGRLDARSHLLVNTPAGTQAVEIVHRGFVWQPRDFAKIALINEVPRRNPHQHSDHVREGVGTPLIVMRPNPRTSVSDRFLGKYANFAATAVLRPDRDAWLARPGSRLPLDRIEIIDPMRVPTVAVGSATAPVTANLDAPIALSQYYADERGPFRYAGFMFPSTVLHKSGLYLIEPYQAGKPVVVFVHGLLDDQYMFGDMIASLCATPGFLDQYQVAIFRYPTGISFLRSAALLRKQLKELRSTLDPAGQDPGLQNIVLVGYSMGGILVKQQISSSGDAIWNLASTRPLDSLVTTPESRETLRELFYFEPVPGVRKVIFLASPHHGSAIADSPVGWIGTRLVQRLPESREIIEQLDRDNPGAIRPLFRKLPSSVDLLSAGGPLLETLDDLPRAPEVELHTVAGHGLLPPDCAHGDGVVPLSSAHIDGAVSELWVPAFHTNMYYQPETIAEVGRILDEFALLRQSAR